MNIRAPETKRVWLLPDPPCLSTMQLEETARRVYHEELPIETKPSCEVRKIQNRLRLSVAIRVNASLIVRLSKVAEDFFVLQACFGSFGLPEVSSGDSSPLRHQRHSP